jgi:P4 family phage/plasmid primase-like protien
MYGNNKMVSIFSTKREALDNLKIGETLFQQGIGNKSAKKFVVGTFDQMWEYSKECKYLHEGFLEDTPVKLCFDLDIKKEHTTGFKSHTDFLFKLTSVMNDFIAHFNSTFNKTVTREDFILLKTDDQPEKVSIHGILKGFAFPSMVFQKQFILDLFHKRPDIETEFEYNGFDMQIYGEKSLRVLGSRKRSNNFPLKIFNLETEELSECNDKNFWFDSLASYTKECEMLIIKKEKKLKEQFFDCNKDTRVIEQLLDLLPGSYYNKGSFGKWLSIGSALYNSQQPFEIFDRFSSQCKDGITYKGKDVLEKQWDSLKSLKYKEEIIHKYAKCENEEAYNQITKETDETLLKFLDQDITTHSFMCEMFFYYFPDDFVYSQGKWYTFTKTGRYLLLDKDEFYIEAYLKIQIMKNSLLEKMKVNKNKWSDEIKSIQSDLGRANVCNHIVKLLPSYYNDPNVYEMLDSNKELIGFDNGVYDLEKDEFRLGRKEDYVSISVDYDYDGDIDTTEVYDIINSMFPNEILTKWFIKWCSSRLTGMNKEEIIVFFIGLGRNGKGLICKLFELAFGGYYTVLSKTYFTQVKKLNSGAEPELVVLKNKRIVVTSETSEDDVFQTSTIKPLAGDDNIENVRMLHSNKLESFSPDFVSVIGSQYIPKFSDIDDGLLSRLIIIPFMYQFMKVNEIDNENPMHKIADINIKSKIKNDQKYRKMFMCLLLKYNKSYKKDGFMSDIPREVKDKTIEYKKIIDPVKCFLTEDIIKDENSFVKFESIITCLKRKYDVSKTSKQIGTLISKHLGKDKTQRKKILGRKYTVLLGYKFVDKNDEDEEDEF